MLELTRANRTTQPQELIPVHPEYNVQDWDRAEGAIDWPRMIKALEEIKRTGTIPPEHYSHDHLNEQKDIPIDQQTYEKWHEIFTRIDEEHQQKDEQIIWVMVDGFLLYWHSVSPAYFAVGEIQYDYVAGSDRQARR